MTAHPINEAFSICHGQLLGKGSTGNVYAGFYTAKPEHRVAIKEIDLSTIDNEVTQYLLSCQIAALSNLGKLENTGHENIVRLVQVVMHQNIMYLVMELLEGGTLADRIKQHPQGMPEQQAMTIFRQILSGYQRIRDKQIIHRDLKPDNILFRQQGGNTVAIIDFGYCTMEEVPNRPKVFYNVGSPKYMAPEAYKQNHYSQKSDIWAIGVMLYEMLMGYTCDKGFTMQNYLSVLENKGIPLPNKLSDFQQRLLAKMLQFNHQNRVGCEHLLHELENVHPKTERLPEGRGQHRDLKHIEMIQQGRYQQPQLISLQHQGTNENMAVQSQPQHEPFPISQQPQQVYRHISSSHQHLPQSVQMSPATPQMQRQNSLTHLRSTITQADLAAMRANRNQGLFHSLMIPGQVPLIMADRNSTGERQLRSQSNMETNENTPEMNPRVLSFHFQNENRKEQPHILSRVDNVRLDSVRQIVHRRQPEGKTNENPQFQSKQGTLMPFPPYDLRLQMVNTHSQYLNGQQNMITNSHRIQPNQIPPQRMNNEIKSAHIIMNSTPRQLPEGNSLFASNFPPKVGNLEMSIYRPPLQPQIHQIAHSQPQEIIERPNFNKFPAKRPVYNSLTPQEQGQMEQNSSARMIIAPEQRVRIVNQITQDLTATRLPQGQRFSYGQNERAINPHPRNIQESVHPQSPQVINLRPEGSGVKNMENRVNYVQMFPQPVHQQMRIMPQNIHPQMMMVRQAANK